MPEVEQDAHLGPDELAALICAMDGGLHALEPIIESIIGANVRRARTDALREAAAVYERHDDTVPDVMQWLRDRADELTSRPGEDSPS